MFFSRGKPSFQSLLSRGKVKGIIITSSSANLESFPFLRHFFLSLCLLVYERSIIPLLATNKESEITVMVPWNDKSPFTVTEGSKNQPTLFRRQIQALYRYRFVAKSIFKRWISIGSFLYPTPNVSWSFNFSSLSTFYTLSVTERQFVNLTRSSYFSYRALRKSPFDLKYRQCANFRGIPIGCIHVVSIIQSSVGIFGYRLCISRSSVRYEINFVLVQLSRMISFMVYH